MQPLFVCHDPPALSARGTWRIKGTAFRCDRCPTPKGFQEGRSSSTYTVDDELLALPPASQGDIEALPRPFRGGSGIRIDKHHGLVIKPEAPLPVPPHGEDVLRTALILCAAAKEVVRNVSVAGECPAPVGPQPRHFEGRGACAAAVAAAEAQREQGAVGRDSLREPGPVAANPFDGTPGLSLLLWRHRHHPSTRKGTRHSPTGSGGGASLRGKQEKVKELSILYHPLVTAPSRPP